MRGPVTCCPGHHGALAGLVVALALVCGLPFCATNVSRAVSSGGADWNSENGGFLGRALPACPVGAEALSDSSEDSTGFLVTYELLLGPPEQSLEFSDVPFKSYSRLKM